MRATLIALCGCGRIGFVQLGGNDAQDAHGPFGPPTRLGPIDSSFDEIVPSLTADELDLLFATGREGLGYHTLWESTRASVDEPFSPPVAVSLQGAPPSSEPALSDDGLQLIFLRNGGELVVTERQTRVGPWSTPATLSTLGAFDNGDYIGDLRLVLSDATNDELYETTRTDREATWAPPRRIDELASPGVRTNFPTASADGLELIFSTSSSGVLQLARATRSSLAMPFEPAEPIDVGFPTVMVGDPELSHDGHVLLFVAQNGTNGDYDIYEMRR